MIKSRCISSASKYICIASRSCTTRTLPYTDLTTFVSYSNSGKVNQQTAVYQGTLYELCVWTLLKNMWNVTSLQHSGGQDDHGVDIQGYWRTGKRKRSHLGLIVQCKSNLKNGATSKIIRELIGAAVTHREKMQLNTIGVLASASELTPSAFTCLMQSKIPLIYLRIERMRPLYDKDGQTHVFPTIEDQSAIKKTIINDTAKDVLAEGKIMLEMNKNPLELSKA